MIFFLFFLFLIDHGYSQSGTFNCESQGALASSPVSCTPGSQKCVKVLFHFLNNTTNTMNSPTDDAFKKMLDELNVFFEAGNIHFTFGNKCVFRSSVTPTLINDQVFVDQFFTNNVFDPKKNPDMGWEEDFLNVYFFQQPIFGGGIARGNWSCHSTFDSRVLAHELGHNLGLVHTFGPVNGGNLLSKDRWECKNRIETGVKGCLTTGDKLCDTEADPYAMDLDNNGIADQGKWVNGCTQNISNFVKDDCNDEVLPWNIPIGNIMSQHLSCTFEFSNCQFRIMHDNLENELKSKKFTLDCEEDVSFETCVDITISTNETWPNATITSPVQLCKGQKIIILSTGSLTLNNCKLTKRVDNPTCPRLSGNWDGIYIQPAAYGSQQVPGGPPSPTGGIINVLNGSTIEFSDNGIQAPGSHNGITINASTMTDNGIAVYSKGPGGLVASGRVTITASTIKSSEFSKPVLIRMDGSNLTVQSSSTITNLGGTSITGIKSFNGKLTVKNSTIKDFGAGIDKELNGGIGIGMVLDGNHFFGSLVSVRNTSSGVTASKNFFQGTIKHIGKAYGRWHANNFLNTFNLDNPSISYRFHENQFNGSYIYFDRLQELTDATCNSWINTATATSHKASKMKESWGGGMVGNTVSSGNKHDGSMPELFVGASSNYITNYHRSEISSSIFTFGGYFLGDHALSITNCNYMLFPTELTGGGVSYLVPYNGESNNQLWISLTQQLTTLETQLGNVTGQNLKHLLESIANVKLAIGQVVLESLQGIDPIIDPTSYSLWLLRADTYINQQVIMVEYWNSNSLGLLGSYINSLSLNVEESTDRNNLSSIINILLNYQSLAKNINILTTSELSPIINYASTTFGSYTSLIRAWLNIVYDIRIDPPVDLTQNSKKPSKNSNYSLSKVTIIPNPSDDCVQLSWLDESSNYQMKLIDLNGITRFEQITNKNQKVCVRDKVGTGLFIIQLIDLISKEEVSTLKLLIN